MIKAWQGVGRKLKLADPLPFMACVYAILLAGGMWFPVLWVMSIIWALMFYYELSCQLMVERMYMSEEELISELEKAYGPLPPVGSQLRIRMPEDYYISNDVRGNALVK